MLSGKKSFQQIGPFNKDNKLGYYSYGFVDVIRLYGDEYHWFHIWLFFILMNGYF
jgi:hypothetical protein